MCNHTRDVFLNQIRIIVTQTAILLSDINSKSVQWCSYHKTKEYSSEGMSRFNNADDYTQYDQVEKETESTAGMKSDWPLTYVDITLEST